MIDARTALLSKILAAVVEQVDSGEGIDQAWQHAHLALDETEGEDAELTGVIEGRELEALRTMVAGWASGERLLPEQDRAVFKRAMKAYKKRLKLARLDDESTIGGGSMSGGRQSGIVAVSPPNQYPKEVWDEMVQQGRLVRGERGMYELPSS